MNNYKVPFDQRWRTHQIDRCNEDADTWDKYAHRLHNITQAKFELKGRVDRHERYIRVQIETEGTMPVEDWIEFVALLYKARQLDEQPSLLNWKTA